MEHRDCRCTINEEIINGKLQTTDKQLIRKVKFNKTS